MKILVLANFGMGLYKFRKELLQELINQKYDVYISFPRDEYVPVLEVLGCKYVETNVDRRGTNPINDLKLFMEYRNIIKSIMPDLILTYTIKPNIYGGIACRLSKIPYIANITGLGTSIKNPGLLQKIVLSLYKAGLKKAMCAFFQNEDNREFFVNGCLILGKTRLIPGSGVNLEQHCLEEYPQDTDGLKFLYIGRIMKDKGINELLKAARQIKAQYPNVQFHIVGLTEEDYMVQLKELENQGIIHYHGQQNDIHSFIKHSHATILPSYHEGTSNVLLETASTGRPVLASNVPGCIETFDEGISGLGFEARNVESLIDVVIKFIELPYEKKKEMGLASRKKMEREYDRKTVINSYMEEIASVLEK